MQNCFLNNSSIHNKNKIYIFFIFIVNFFLYFYAISFLYNSMKNYQEMIFLGFVY